MTSTPGAGRAAHALRGLILGVWLLGGTPAQAAPVWAPEATQDCVRDAAAASPAQSGYGALDCVGRSSQVCMSQADGGTTIGMMDCWRAELSYWEQRMRQAYAQQRAAAQKEDRAIKALHSAAEPVAKTLRARQQAWRAYRDAACRHEQALWRGGTGGGPATLACHTHETARQALRLEGWWAQ